MHSADLADHTFNKLVSAILSSWQSYRIVNYWVHETRLGNLSPVLRDNTICHSVQLAQCIWRSFCTVSKFQLVHCSGPKYRVTGFPENIPNRLREKMGVSIFLSKLPAPSQNMQQALNAAALAIVEHIWRGRPGPTWQPNRFEKSLRKAFWIQRASDACWCKADLLNTSLIWGLCLKIAN